MVSTMPPSLAKSKLLSRISTCMVKPAAKPMPWIGGGGSTRTVASSIPLIALLRLPSIGSKPCFLPRTAQSLRMT